MNVARPIDYQSACNYFKEAEKKGEKLLMGDINTNFWLHKEKINLDFVRDTARKFTDARIFIIAEGKNKGFYMYSETSKTCLLLFDIASKIPHAQFV